jgi:hypothetical protein
VSAAPVRVRVRAPAKVNLSLAVLGKRPGGFHEVETSMLALELSDLLELAREPGGRVRIELSGAHASADIPRDETNLAARAARAALELARSADGLVVRLEKHIPSGSGLGGGSSDAAAAWIGAATLLGLDPWSAGGRARSRHSGPIASSSGRPPRRATRAASVAASASSLPRRPPPRAASRWSCPPSRVRPPWSTQPSAAARVR